MLFALISGTRLFVRGSIVTEGGPLILPGPIYPAFVVFFSALGTYVLIAIWQASRLEPSAFNKNRLKWVGLAFIAANGGGSAHFLSVFLGQFISHDLFLIAFALILGYAILKRRLYDMELLSRDAAVRLGTLALLVIPLIMGRLLASAAPGMDIPTLARTLTTLAAAVLFFSLAATLVRHDENPSSLQLARVFFLWSVLNMATLAWILPSNPFSLLIARLTYLLACWLLLAWIDYRRSYLQPVRGRVRPSSGSIACGATAAMA